MIITYNLNDTQYERFLYTFNEYIRVFNIVFKKCINRKERDITGKRIKQLTKSDLTLKLLNAIPQHCRDLNHKLNPVSPIKSIRLKNIKLNCGQFIFNYITFTFDLRQYFNNLEYNAYTDIKMSLNGRKLIVRLDIKNIELRKTHPQLHKFPINY